MFHLVNILKNTEIIYFQMVNFMVCKIYGMVNFMVCMVCVFYGMCIIFLSYTDIVFQK